MISEKQHLDTVEQVKMFFRGHLQKLKDLVGQKQQMQNTSNELIKNLQNRLQMVSIELENNQIELAEKSTKLSIVQQEVQQIKIDKIVNQDDMNNFQRELGKLTFFVIYFTQ